MTFRQRIIRKIKVLFKELPLQDPLTPLVSGQVIQITTSTPELTPNPIVHGSSNRSTRQLDARWVLSDKLCYINPSRRFESDFLIKDMRRCLRIVLDDQLGDSLMEWNE